MCGSGKGERYLVLCGAINGLRRGGLFVKSRERHLQRACTEFWKGKNLDVAARDAAFKYIARCAQVTLKYTLYT